jgi:hypothetical protein
MADTLISPIEHPSEAIEYLDCFLVDTLNEHGRCARCGSNAVMQYMVLEQSCRRIKVAGAPYLVSGEQPQGKQQRKLLVFPNSSGIVEPAQEATRPDLRAPVPKKRYA